MKDTLLAMTGKFNLETWLAVTRYRFYQVWLSLPANKPR